MKPSIKINFTDFWTGFVKDNNYFFNLLSTRYNVILDEDPDYLFYSCFGKEYLKYKCIRIYYSAENLRPDFTGCDYALTFDFNNRQNHFRFPLYGYYIDMYPKQLSKDVSNLFRKRSRDELKKAWLAKKKFCCIVVSNGSSKKRINFFKKLNSYKAVDSGGKFMNNVGGPVALKLDFIKDYRFVISFENSSYPGYTTEKILEPILTDSIPIYWGNPKVGLDFNENRFLDYRKFPSEESLIAKILELENDVEKALDVIVEPPFPGGTTPPVFIQDEKVLAFFDRIIREKGSKRKVADSPKRYIHRLKLQWEKLLWALNRLQQKFKR